MDAPFPEDAPESQPVILPGADIPPLGEPGGEEEPVVLSAWGPPPPPVDTRTLLFMGALGFCGVVYVVLLIVGGLGARFAGGGVEVLPFFGLALLAYAGVSNGAFRALTYVYWLLLIGAAVLITVALAAMANVDVTALSKYTHEVTKAMEAAKAAPGGPPRQIPMPNMPPIFVPHGIAHVFWASVGCFGAVLVGAWAFSSGVRRLFAGWLPNFNPDSFVHAVALATVVALTFTMFAPLAATGEPPFLAIIRNFTGADLGPGGQMLADQLADQNMLLDQVFSFMWLVPVGIMVVGWPLHRTLPQALRRVGFVMPQEWHVAFALGLAGAMAVFMSGLGDPAIGRLWDLFGWPKTDEKAFEQLFKSMTSPIGAVVIGVTAGIGEELLVRGILQPRLGILLSNLFFTSLHALQYNWDALLSVFLVGMLLGLVRKKTNTTTSAIVHGTYDFLLVLASVYGIDPSKWFWR
jgi:membrane protease YdiL (CAAX protease family)